MQPLDSLRALSADSALVLLLVELQVEAVDFSLQAAFAIPLFFELALRISNFAFEVLLLFVETINLIRKLLLVSTIDVEFLDAGLNVLETLTLLIFKIAAVLIKPSLLLPSVGLQFIGVHLVDSQFLEFKLTSFVVLLDLQFGLLATHLLLLLLN